jgi:hypothetical protein
MHFPVFRKYFVPKSEFINFWSKQYFYPKDYLYNDNIGKELIEDRIWDLFLWKNGKPLLEKKKLSVKNNFIMEKTKVPSKHDNLTLLSYLDKPGGMIWRIFWLHCNYPKIFPIYDQHVHRAMAKLKNWPKIDIPSLNKTKIRTYINHYLPFWRKFFKFPPKKVDEALWSYGKFLKLKYDFK